MSRPVPLAYPEPLTERHVVDDFSCGKPALDTYLKRFAMANQQSGAARTYVTHRGGVVVGYYSLAAASVEYAEVPMRLAKGAAKHPIPLTLLARLAVDSREQGKGVGMSLLQDALLRHLQAQGIIGSRALLVHAKDESAAAFYAKFGFEPSPIDPYHLFLMNKDIKRTLGKQGSN